MGKHRKKDLEHQVRELHSLNFSQREIGNQLNVSHTAIGRWLKSWGIGPDRYSAPKGMSWPNETQLYRFWSLVNKKSDPEGCWLWTGKLSTEKYGEFHLATRIMNSRGFSHRFSLALKIGEAIPKGAFVLHSCDVPACVNPLHLRLGTHQDNTKDMIDRGRQSRVRGESNGRSKLTKNEVCEIHLRLSSGESGSSVADDFGVNRKTIYNIKSGKTWYPGTSSQSQK